MKTRTIVWTIVGILVVAAIIFTIIARRGAAVLEGKRTMTEEDYRDYKMREEKRLAKFEERYQRRAGSISNPTEAEKAKMDEVTTKIAQLKTYLAEYEGLTTDEARKEWYEKCRTTEKEMKKAFRELFRMGEEEGEE
ncbi:MAG: hypothetical protein ABIK81_00595 [candidate division WOR-3 bacterium]